MNYLSLLQHRATIDLFDKGWDIHDIAKLLDVYVGSVSNWIAQPPQSRSEWLVKKCVVCGNEFRTKASQQQWCSITCHIKHE